VRNIFICSLVVFWASSRMMNGLVEACGRACRRAGRSRPTSDGDQPLELAELEERVQRVVDRAAGTGLTFAWMSPGRKPGRSPASTAGRHEHDPADPAGLQGLDGLRDRAGTSCRCPRARSRRRCRSGRCPAGTSNCPSDFGVDLDARAEDRARHRGLRSAGGRLHDLEERGDVGRLRVVDVLQADERRDGLVHAHPRAADVDVAVADDDLDAGGLLDFLEISVVRAEQLGEFLASADGMDRSI
jgi:hypothetical protein